MSTPASWVGPVAAHEWLEQRRMIPCKSRLDVALITHPRDANDMPRVFPWAKHLSENERHILTKYLRPGFAEIIGIQSMTIGLLFVPMYASDIFTASPSACLRILQEEALPLAAQAGARIVSLGGLTGVLSLYGQALQTRAAQLGLTVTTGHATTVVSVVQTYKRAIDELEMTAGDRLVILGVGSIGAAVVRLLATQPHPPRSVVLVDQPKRKPRLDALATELRELAGLQVSVELTSRKGELSPNSACYASRAVISAVSTPYIVDVDRVAPGTILVDDSQPYCWSRESAWRRCHRMRDIAPCEAGLVNCHSIDYHSFFPFDFADHGERGSQIAWSCLAEGLLAVLEPDLPPTVGEPILENVRRYEQAFHRWGFAVPPLQCGSNELPVAAMRESHSWG